MILRTLRLSTVLLAAAVALATFAVRPSSADPAEATTGSVRISAAAVVDRDPRVTGRAGIPRSDRDRVLGGGWASSDDRIVVGRGDSSGFHVLTAESANGYRWSTVATLRAPLPEVDRWVGNVCVSESGRYAAVSYAPRTFTNEEPLMLRGGYAAVVDLRSGAVTHLEGVRSSLAYSSPGCGVGDSAVFTQFAGEGEGRDGALSRLIEVDLASGESDRMGDVEGQVTSAVPTGVGVMAAAGPSLVSIDSSGRAQRVTKVGSVPFNLVATGGDGLSYMTSGGSSIGRVEYTPLDGDAKPRVLARGPLDETDLEPGAGSTAIINGHSDAVGSLPDGVLKVAGPRPWLVSSRGRMVVRTAATPVLHRGREGRASAAAVGAWQRAMSRVPSALTRGAEPITATMESPITRRSFPMEVTPDSTEVSEAPFDGSADQHGAVGERGSSEWVSGTVDKQATCSVPRNSLRTQVYQPNPDQVEWAADMAVKGKLSKKRVANWQDSGMAHGWRPQELFEPRRHDGKLVRVPAQILLGILAQESNLAQASWHSLPGIPGNPLVGDFYGSELADPDSDDPFTTDWAEADCGYGISQLTDGMRKKEYARPGEQILPEFEQRAVAMDYATNIAAGLRVLQQKWIETTEAGIVHGKGSSKWLENWFTAVWAYNSGFYPEDDPQSGAWGVGWFNNPINPIYPANRDFFGQDPADYAEPEKWPYPEKVIGFAAYSINLYGEPGFRPAGWVDDSARDNAKPPVDLFCQKSNDCYPGKLFQPNAPGVEDADPTPCGHQDPKGRYDLKCWWHDPYYFNNCDGGLCGHEFIRYPADEYQNKEPAGSPNNYPNCSLDGLPKGARVVDDLADPVGPELPYPNRCPNDVVTNAGSFRMQFRSGDDPGSSRPKVPGRIDFHQSGAGFNGHVWWAHTRTADAYAGKMEAKGTWTFDKPVNRWARVLVHVPDYAAHTQQAGYMIHTAQGTKTRYLLQRTQEHRWASLGVFKFDGKPKITLSSRTYDGDGSDDIAWDAAAIQPLDKKPKDFVVVLGDSYTSGEGASAGDGSDYYHETNYGGDLDDTDGRNACHRSRLSWPRKTNLSGYQDSLGELTDRWSTKIDFQFHACSGAKTNNINPDHSAENPQENPMGARPKGQYGEMSQIDKGYLDKNATLVMLSIGGNDARFADIIKKCVTWQAPQPYCYETTLDGDDEPMETAVPKAITGPVRESIEDTLHHIADRAPKAKILLMGYPVLLNEEGTSVPGVGAEEAQWMNEVTRDTMVDAMTRAAADAVADGISVTYANPIDEFDGHWIDGDPEAVRAIVNDKVESDKPGLERSSQSFHPNTYGTTLYSHVADQALQAMR